MKKNEFNVNLTIPKHISRSIKQRYIDKLSKYENIPITKATHQLLLKDKLAFIDELKKANIYHLIETTNGLDEEINLRNEIQEILDKFDRLMWKVEALLYEEVTVSREDWICAEIANFRKDFWD